jgi:hypothetical protein
VQDGNLTGTLEVVCSPVPSGAVHLSSGGARRRRLHGDGTFEGTEHGP